MPSSSIYIETYLSIRWKENKDIILLLYTQIKCNIKRISYQTIQIKRLYEAYCTHTHNHTQTYIHTYIHEGDQQTETKTEYRVGMIRYARRDRKQ